MEPPRKTNVKVETDFIALLNILSPPLINEELRSVKGGSRGNYICDQFRVNGTNLLLNLYTTGNKTCVDSILEIPSSISVSEQTPNFSLDNKKKKNKKVMEKKSYEDEAASDSDEHCMTTKMKETTISKKKDEKMAKPKKPAGKAPKSETTEKGMKPAKPKKVVKGKQNSQTAVLPTNELYDMDSFEDVTEH